jgi:hypothetical protein
MAAANRFAAQIGQPHTVRRYQLGFEFCRHGPPSRVGVRGQTPAPALPSRPGAGGRRGMQAVWPLTIRPSGPPSPLPDLPRCGTLRWRLAVRGILPSRVLVRLGGKGGRQVMAARLARDPARGRRCTFADGRRIARRGRPVHTARCRFRQGAGHPAATRPVRRADPAVVTVRSASGTPPRAPRLMAALQARGAAAAHHLPGRRAGCSRRAAPNRPSGMNQAVSSRRAG